MSMLLEKWRALSQRERYLVGGAGVFLTIIILYAAIWDPIVGGAQRAELLLQKKQADLIWMQQSAAEVRALRQGSPGAGQQRTGQSLLGLIESTARQSKLSTGIQQVQPDGQNKVRLKLDNIPFDELLTWLDDLAYKYGVQVSEFSVERKPEAGRVDARLVLES